jgi:hypothetical protein
MISRVLFILIVARPGIAQSAWTVFSNFFLPSLSQPDPGTAAVLVDELDAGRFQGAPNCQVVGRRHGRFAVSELGAANCGDTHSGFPREILGAPVN